MMHNPGIEINIQYHETRDSSLFLNNFKDIFRCFQQMNPVSSLLDVL